MIARSHSATIIIAAYKAERWIQPCLESLVKSIDPHHHIYVIDNGFNNNAIPISCNFSNYTILKTPTPLGFAEANNFGLLNLAEMPAYFCFFNQDTISTPGWLDTCIECMEKNPRLGAVMPFITQYDGTGMDPAFAKCREAAYDTGETTNDRNLLIVPEITAAAMVVRAAALFKSGPFDPVFGSYCEDFDLGDRIKENGYQLGICSKAKVAHFSGSASIGKTALIRKGSLSISNRALLKCRRTNRWRALLAVRLFLLDFPRRLIRALLRRPGAHPIKGVLMAYSRLLKLFPRLISANQDRRLFRKYLKQINWNMISSSKASYLKIKPE